MKKLTIILIGILIHYESLPQSCLPDGIEFTSQSQIDDFQLNYPNCTNILGNVIIDGIFINNLNGLSVLTSIEGNLEIKYAGELTDLVGLSNLEYIHGILWIKYNNSLSDLTGLEALDTIGGLWIWDNNCMTSLSGIDNISYFDELFLYFNDTLSDLTALSNSITAKDIMIAGCHSLTNLNGLNNITSCASIELNSNNSLNDLSALMNLTTVNNENIFIEDNPSLTSLSGLDNIQANSIANLYIINNSSLTTCEVRSVCDYLASPNGVVDIQNNFMGCNSLEEVESACGVGLSDKRNRKQSFEIYPNPSSDIAIIKISVPFQQSKYLLNVLDCNGKEVLSHNLNEQQTAIDVSGLTSGIYIVKIISSTNVLVSKMVVK